MLIVFKWWAAMLLLGAACLPLSGFVFREFKDNGWLFSKMLGLFLCAWVMWTLNCLKWLTFVRENIWMTVLSLAVVNYGGYAFYLRYVRLRRAEAYEHAGIAAQMKNAAAGGDLFDRLSGGRCLILLEEAGFAALFALSVYIVGFKPDAYGTEKFMDYGFITSMMRSLTMPFADMWYSGEAVNYYYGGQYITAFLIKMTDVTAGEGYNLMRALVTAASFMLPFSLVCQLLSDSAVVRTGAGHRRSRTRAVINSGGSDDTFNESSDEAAAGGSDETPVFRTEPDEPADHIPAKVPVLGGLLGGCAVAFCGSFHYVIYGIILPVVNRIRGIPYSYWFPDTTRYIGYDPDLPDKTIHEFPAYSSVLGDLHAHYLNILFVVTVTAVVYGWAQKRKGRAAWSSPVMECISTALCPEVLLIGFMTGVFRWTNFWDFPIYYVVTGSIFFFVLLSEWRKRLPLFAVTILLIAAVMFGVGTLGALPFTATFFQISSEIGRTHSHTLLYQLVILWGLPAAVLAGYIVSLALEGRALRKEGRKPHMDLPDLCVLMFGLCAAGLVFLPEVIYVKDIYSEAHYRANTMFKLTYQAFILFGMCMAYILVRELAKGRRFRTTGAETKESPAPRPAAPRPGWYPALLGTVVLLITGGYMIQSVYSWFGNIFRPDMRVDTDASVFVSEYFESDYDAINYLNTEVEEQPVLLEAQGDSYSDYGRVSVATGLPTVAGWYVHEWLWRQDTDALDARIADIGLIYMTRRESAELAKALIQKYGISYIYVGNLERERYPDLSDEALKALGEVVFDDGVTYIIKV